MQAILRSVGEPETDAAAERAGEQADQDEEQQGAQPYAAVALAGRLLLVDDVVGRDRGLVVGLVVLRQQLLGTSTGEHRTAAEPERRGRVAPRDARRVRLP